MTATVAIVELVRPQRVAGWSSGTSGVTMAGWYCSRLVKKVQIAAAPIAPPRVAALPQ